VEKKYLVRKDQPEEPKKVSYLVAHPASSKAPKESLTFPGRRQFADGHEKILPHHILGSLQEFKMEALARGNTEVADVIEVSHPDVTAAALKEKHGGEKKKKKAPQAQLAQDKALQNWSRHMAIRKKQEKYLGEILQRPENELQMSISDNYRQIREECDLIDRSLPALLPGKGYRVGSEFWSQPERIGDELSGLMLTLTRTERGYPQPITHVGKPHTIQMETGLKPPTKIPCHLTVDKSLFLKHRRQELKPVLEEMGFYKPDLEGLEVIGKGQPFTSVSAEALPDSTTSEEIETLDPLSASCSVSPEGEMHPSLVFCGQPARWIQGTTYCMDEIGIAARLTFESLTGEEAESSLTVSNDGTAAIWYSWMRLPQQIPSRETKGKRMPCFYFDTRPGVILPGETLRFSFLFKSERAGIFSESWEFRTHPLLLGGALLQVTLWGIAVCEDKLADFRERLESDLSAREGAAIVEDCLNELLDQIRTPERSPSPVDACAMEEELFHQKNPELHYQHQVVKQLHKLWRQRMTIPSAFEEKVPSGQSTPEPLPAQNNTMEVPDGKNSLEEAPKQRTNVEEEEAAPSQWNLSLKDFKQSGFRVVSTLWCAPLSSGPADWEQRLRRAPQTVCFLSQAIMSIPREEQREEALTQLNKAALELCVEQRPTQSDLLYPLCLQLWRGAIDDMVNHALRLRSLYNLLEKDTCVDAVPKETEEEKQHIKAGKKDKIATENEERKYFGDKDKEGKKSRARVRKEKEESPSPRKLRGKDKKTWKSSSSLEEVKEGAQAVEAVTTDGASVTTEAPQKPVDPNLLRTYQEKLYIEVYRLLDSMLSEMVSLFEDL
ncbi:MYCBP-associated protein, partial [Acanthisitta chloris]